MQLLQGRHVTKALDTSFNRIIERWLGRSIRQIIALRFFKRVKCGHKFNWPRNISKGFVELFTVNSRIQYHKRAGSGTSSVERLEKANLGGSHAQLHIPVSCSSVSVSVSLAEVSVSVSANNADATVSASQKPYIKDSHSRHGHINFQLCGMAGTLFPSPARLSLL